MVSRKWYTVTDIPDDTLFMAIYHQNSELTQLLLDHGAQLNGKHDIGIQLAAREGNVEVVKELLERGVNVTLKGRERSTALLSVLSEDDHVIPQQSKIDIVKLLLEHGAPVDVQDDKKNTPLKCAIKSRSAEIVKLLIDKINDLALVYQLDKGEYLLEEDVLSSPDVLKLFLDAGANPNISHSIQEYTPLLKVDNVDSAKILIVYGANVDQRDTYGVCPILHAVKKSNYKLIELLLESGADITLSANFTSAESILQRNPRQILVRPGLGLKWYPLPTLDAHVHLMLRERCACIYNYDVIMMWQYHVQRCLDSRSSVQSEVQQYPKLRSLLKTFINDDSDIQGDWFLVSSPQLNWCSHS